MVNTFLPYPDIERSVATLDNKRLGKQRVECHQILGILLDWPTKDGKKRTGWRNHSATRMWRGYPDALKVYMDASVKEWVRRGMNNSYELWNFSDVEMPPWFGSAFFHRTHRQVLLFKDFDHYSQFGWEEEPKHEYFWPC